MDLLPQAACHRILRPTSLASISFSYFFYCDYVYVTGQFWALLLVATRYPLLVGSHEFFKEKAPDMLSLLFRVYELLLILRGVESLVSYHPTAELKRDWWIFVEIFAWERRRWGYPAKRTINDSKLILWKSRKQKSNAKCQQGWLTTHTCSPTLFSKVLTYFSYTPLKENN